MRPENGMLRRTAVLAVGACRYNQRPGRFEHLGRYGTCLNLHRINPAMNSIQVHRCADFGWSDC
jgi:hypothetical protein